MFEFQSARPEFTQLTKLFPGQRLGVIYAASSKPEITFILGSNSLPNDNVSLTYNATGEPETDLNFHGRVRYCVFACTHIKTKQRKPFRALPVLTKSRSTTYPERTTFPFARPTAIKWSGFVPRYHAAHCRISEKFAIRPSMESPKLRKKSVQCVFPPWHTDCRSCYTATSRKNRQKWPCLSREKLELQAKSGFAAFS